MQEDRWTAKEEVSKEEDRKDVFFLSFSLFFAADCSAFLLSSAILQVPAYVTGPQDQRVGTSIIFCVDHQAGALLKALQVFEV